VERVSPTLKAKRGGQMLAITNYNTGKTFKVTTAITGASAADQQLYQTERYDENTGEEMKYIFNVLNGKYKVRLHFVETYVSGLGARIFDVAIQGSMAFNNLDIFAEAGSKFKALVKTKTTTVTNGQLSIEFFHDGIENPKICGIEIIPAGTTPPPPPPTPPPPSNTIRVNAGGPSFTDFKGNLWVVDAGYYNTGKTFKVTAAITGVSAADQQLYQTERWDDITGEEMKHVYSMANGKYEVRLHFVETYVSGFGARIFDVMIQGSLAFNNLDIFAEADDKFKALVKSKITTVTNGQLSIEFLHGDAQNPKICGTFVP
jgi:hypothetical protein